MSQTLNAAIAVIGIDIGKNSFHVVGHDERGAIVLRQKWSRGQVEARFANMPPCLIGMEACVSAHYLSHKLNSLGHNARLMPAKCVRPYSRQPLLGRFDPGLEPMALPDRRLDQHNPCGLHEQNPQIAISRTAIADGLSRRSPNRRADIFSKARKSNRAVLRPLRFPRQGRDAPAQQPRSALRVEGCCSCSALGNAEQRTRP